MGMPSSSMSFITKVISFGFIGGCGCNNDLSEFVVIIRAFTTRRKYGCEMIVLVKKHTQEDSRHKTIRMKGMYLIVKRPKLRSNKCRYSSISISIYHHRSLSRCPSVDVHRLVLLFFPTAGWSSRCRWFLDGHKFLSLITPTLNHY